MIRINLLGDSNKRPTPTVLGVEVNEVPIVQIIIAILIGTQGFSYWRLNYGPASEIPGKREEITQLRNNLAKLRKKSEGLKKIQEQIAKIEAQNVALEKRLNVVKSIIRNKKNPFQVLHYVAKKIPDDMWLTEVSLKEDSLILTGQTRSYKSIGLFLASLGDSIFFTQPPTVANYKTVTDKATRERTEEFKIVGRIERYN